MQSAAKRMSQQLAIVQRGCALYLATIKRPMSRPLRQSQWSRELLQMLGNSKSSLEMMCQSFTMTSLLYQVLREYQKKQPKSAAKSKQNPLQRVMATLAEIFTPIIPALIVGGLILGFRNVLEGVHWSMLDGKTITEVSKFWSGINHFLWLPGEAIFQFLPVGITWSVSRKMGTSQILGIVLGICLVSPQIAQCLFSSINTSS